MMSFLTWIEKRRTMYKTDTDTYRFDDRFIRELPGDKEKHNFVRQVPDACYSLVSPKKASAPQLVAVSREVADQLEFDPDFLKTQEFVRMVSGNTLLKGMQPYAMCYGGHQFGNWAGQLGDGRAINLGERILSNGSTKTLQLKGAGPTPYSRNADGLAVLRSSVREFLCSEAMAHLGVPTTRALSLVLTGDEVERDMFYDGHPKMEPGAIVCRVSDAFIRFGNFEILAARQDYALLKRLLDFTIAQYFPDLLKGREKNGKDTQLYIDWFRQVAHRTLEMILHWMRVGFVHGVMNTDNMSVLGETIDYGPYGWLEGYDPSWTPNTTDAAGRRYCFGNQPGIAQWNLAKLGNALYPLIGQAKPLQEIIEDFGDRYKAGFVQMMGQKLGIRLKNQLEDSKLVMDLLDLLAVTETDTTIFFRSLSASDMPAIPEDMKKAELQSLPIAGAWYSPDEITPAYQDKLMEWLCTYADRVNQEGLNRKQRSEQMDKINPKYVLRNYMAQLAIDKAERGDFSLIEDLLELLRHPYDEQPSKEEWAQQRPEWARHKPGCSMLSCSS